MKILALDMATSTGWAFIDTDDPNASYKSGVLQYREKMGRGRDRTEKPLCLVERLLRFRSDLQLKLIGNLAPNLIVYEQAHHRGGPATRSGLGMETVLIMEAAHAGRTSHGVHSGTLKKFCTGQGKAEKEAMIAFAKFLTQREITDDNEADAICLAHWGAQHAVENEWGGVTVLSEKRVPKKSKSTRKTKEVK